MNKLLRRFNHLKLNQKFTIITFLFVFVPILLFSNLLFRSMKTSIIQDKMTTIQTMMAQDNTQIQKTIEVCNISTQVFLNSPNLIEYLSKVKRKVHISTIENLDFFRNDIASFEKLINSNPYLYQIRVYADSSSMQEMMPILYSRERMKNMEWSSNDFNSSMWYIDYPDNIFPSYANAATMHLMGLLTRIIDSNYGDLGYLEVAVQMETVLPDLYKSNEASWLCYIDEHGNAYYDRSEDNIWSKDAERILSAVDLDSDQNTISETYYNGQTVILAYAPVKEFKGKMVRVVSLKDEMNTINNQRNMFFIYMLIILAILLMLINQVVKVLLKRFYLIFDTVKLVQKGDLDVTVPCQGTDEMGELATQINKMLIKIKKLMEDNLNRELLVKNSEIRALQNQINAHFIYNVLESIKMMAEIDAKYAIADAVTSLGKLLRYSMKWTSRNVTVAQEIDYIRNYLALINLRFDYEIYLSLNIPDIIWEQEIPKMSLQPIIENAICHGIEQIAEDTSIYVKGIVHRDHFIIEITDSGRGMTEEEVGQLYKKIAGEIETGGGSGNGIGLKNVQDRIRMTFGPEYGLSIASKIGCYTKVIVKIPLKN